MRTGERLARLKNWTYDAICKDRTMKTPSPDGTIAGVTWVEPKVYLGFHPTRPDVTGQRAPEPVNIVPSVTIMFGQSHAQNMTEQRFDRYDGTHRPKEMGGILPVTFLFAVYEPGDRLDRFQDSPVPEYLIEGSEAGLFALTEWMDDLTAALLGAENIPESDLFIWANTLRYSPYTEMDQIADKRPYYYGFVTCDFGTRTERLPNDEFNALLN